MSNYINIKEPESPAEMQSLTRDDVSRLVAQRQIKDSIPSVIESLVFLGRFEAALSLLDLSLANDDFTKEKRTFVTRLLKAESRDDDHKCECKSEIDLTDYVRLELLPESERSKHILLKEQPRYIRKYRFFSTNRNEWMWFYECQECHCIQALPDHKQIDELHAQQYNNAEQVLSEAFKSGVPVRDLRKL